MRTHSIAVLIRVPVPTRRTTLMTAQGPPQMRIHPPTRDTMSMRRPITLLRGMVSRGQARMTSRRLLKRSTSFLLIQTRNPIALQGRTDPVGRRNLTVVNRRSLLPSRTSQR